MNDNNRKVTVDAPSVEPDEALKFMTHHLTLAAVYFEAVSDDHKTNIAIMLRSIKAGQDKNVKFIPMLDASVAFYQSLQQQYDALSDD